jgi:hypothetical protein
VSVPQSTGILLFTLYLYNLYISYYVLNLGNNFINGKEIEIKFVFNFLNKSNIKNLIFLVGQI